jgi:hypothetical protein
MISSPFLKYLNLFGFDIGEREAEALCAADWPILEKVSMNNVGLSCEGARALRNVKWQALRHLNMRD